MSDAVRPPLGGPSAASQTRAARQARRQGRRPLKLKLSRRWWPVAVVAVVLFTAGRGYIPIVSGWKVSRDLIRMDAEYRALVAENDALDDQVKFSRTPEGMDAIARQKLFVTAPGEILVSPVGRPAAATTSTTKSPGSIGATLPDWRKEAAEWLRANGAILHRWAVDPPDVVAAREKARAKQKPSSADTEPQ